MPSNPTEPLIASAARVAELAADAADEIEEARGLPQEIVDEMATSGLFQLFLRRSAGGPAADPATAARVVETLARADASTAWCSMVSSTLGYLAGWLDGDVLAEITGDPPDLRLSGSSRPLGRAVAFGGGHRVSGRWDFASGVGHANWLLVAYEVDDLGPRMGFVPATEGRVVDTWTTMGMRGTGSHDLVLDDVEVPLARTVWFENEPAEHLPLYDPRLLRVTTHSPAAAVALGIAQGALDAFADLATETASTSSPVPLRERRDVAVAYARASARLAGSRRRFHDGLDRAWEAVTDDRDARTAVAEARLAMALVGDDAGAAAEGLLAVAGTSGVFARHGLERRVRDLHVVRQFSTFAAANLEGAGRVLLGLEPDGPGW